MKAFLLIGLLALAVGCAQTKPTTEMTPPNALGEPSSRSDDSISNEVRRRLAAEGPELSRVVANVKNGVVSLSGSVNTVRAAYRAEAAARAVQGVTGVQNTVMIHSPSL